jgi:hypothetical protein
VDLVGQGSAVNGSRVTGDSPTRTLLAGLFDDAAMYPPGDMPLPQAVAAHLKHRAAPHGFAVGPFVCGAASLGEVARHAVRHLEGTDEPFPVSVIAPDAEALASLRAAVPPDSALAVAALEVPLSDPDLRHVTGSDVPVYVELPVAAIDDAVAGRLAGRGLLLKLRTGGLRAAAFPTETALARAVAAAVRAGLAFKCTAGLHHAVRHRDATTGFEHHGFLNVILAALVARGGGEHEVLEAIALREPRELAARIADLDAGAARSARSSFRSFGTCSIAEPWADLRSLGLLGGLATVGTAP